MSRPVPHSRPLIGESERRAVEDVLASGMLVDGALRRRFADALRGLSTSITHASLFPSGRAGLRAALQSLELPAGAGVIIQTYVCDAAPWAIREAGLRVILCDIADGWAATTPDMQRAVEAGASAIVLAPPFGLRSSAAPFRAFGLPIIHDLCQASPLILTDSEAADLGDMVVLSFHPTKYMCAGAGGAVLDVSGRSRSRLAQLADDLHAMAPFSELQAAIGLAQLARLPAMRSRRAAIAGRYLARIPEAFTRRLAGADVALGDMFRLPLDLPDHDVDELLGRFHREGVLARRGVDDLAHRRLAMPDALFPNAVQAFNRTLSLPFHPSLSDGEVDMVIDAISRLLP